LFKFNEQSRAKEISALLAVARGGDSTPCPATQLTSLKPSQQDRYSTSDCRNGHQKHHSASGSNPFL
jgi:hypothetical protein